MARSPQLCAINNYAALSAMSEVCIKLLRHELLQTTVEERAEMFDLTYSECGLQLLVHEALSYLYEALSYRGSEAHLMQPTF